MGDNHFITRSRPYNALMPAPAPTSTSIALPSPQQVREYLQAFPASGPPGWVTWTPLALLLGAMMLAMSHASAIAQLAPWAALAVLYFIVAARVKRMRLLEKKITLVQEMALTRRTRAAFDQAWSLLPALAISPELHSRAVAFIGHLLDQLKAYEAGIVAFDFLIDRLPTEHPASVQLRVHRAICQLACDHRADADDAIRRLRMLQEPLGASPVHAAYHFAVLMQCVRTRNYDDAVKRGDTLIDALRPLGVEAGYGYALMALSCSALSKKQTPAFGDRPSRDREGADRQTEGGCAVAGVLPSLANARGSDDAATRGVGEAAAAPTLASQAATWWSHATLLLPPGELCERFAELAALRLEGAEKPETQKA